MAVRKRPDTGKWETRVKGADDKRISRSFYLKSDAEKWERHQLLLADAGKVPQRMSGQEKLGTVAKEWLQRLGSSELKPRTMDGYQRIWASLVSPRWADVCLKDIRSTDVHTWVTTMTGTREMPPGSRPLLSASRRKQALQVLAMILDHAVRSGLASTNAARSDAVGAIKQPKYAGHREHQYLTVQQLNALAQEACAYEDFVFFLGTTGLRLGEAIALKVSDIQPTSRRLRVTKSISEVNGKQIVVPTKTHKPRYLTLPSATLERINHRLAGHSGGNPLFPAPNGGMLRQANFRRRVWIPAVKSAGLEGFRIHDLRHTAASLAIAAGANVKVVQNMLGHASAQMTLDCYAGLFENDQAEVALRLDELIAKNACHEFATKPPRIRDARTVEITESPLLRRFSDVAPAGFEPATHGLGNRRSIP